MQPAPTSNLWIGEPFQPHTHTHTHTGCNNDFVHFAPSSEYFNHKYLHKVQQLQTPMQERVSARSLPSLVLVSTTRTRTGYNDAFLRLHRNADQISTAHTWGATPSSLIAQNGCNFNHTHPHPRTECKQDERPESDFLRCFTHTRPVRGCNENPCRYIISTTRTCTGVQPFGSACFRVCNFNHVHWVQSGDDPEIPGSACCNHIHPHEVQRRYAL